MILRIFIASLLLCGWTAILTAQEPLTEYRSFSGIYPHLASFNSQGECGTGAVVNWANRIWWMTYSPHEPKGSDDKLYSMDAYKHLTIHPESIGGTPANRMIHTPSKQLLIGPYVIDKAGKVRVIPYNKMVGRLTGTAAHLTDPANKVYYATMEEGFYEVDVNTLAVKELFADANYDKDPKAPYGAPYTNAIPAKGHGGTLLPGYHGKGLYSGQKRLIYANNGEFSPLAREKPDIPSGVLAEWDGQGKWNIVRRNQFTEVTGPDDIYGSSKNAPVWSIGWDHRSLILMCLDSGQWHTYRLPKASHCYDGAHGWNTEWPRIRHIAPGQMLMTMHGQFWDFPETFSATKSMGIRPRSSYLKVVGDFSSWLHYVVLGTDDAAKNEFLNTRKVKGKVAGPAESQSNLCFIFKNKLYELGPALGRGGPWFKDEVAANTPSDPFLFDNFTQRSLHLHNHSNEAVEITLEVDLAGNQNWYQLMTINVPANGYQWTNFTAEHKGTWVRLSSNRAATLTAHFEYREPDKRTNESSAIFAGLSTTTNRAGGMVRAGKRDQGLQLVANGANEPFAGYYELKPNLKFERGDAASAKKLAAEITWPTKVLSIVDETILYTDDDGQKYRLPIGNPEFLKQPSLLDLQRTSREVVTERDLFQAAGIFYELPARNAGGFAKIRPICTHNYLIQDYCSWRGLMAITGIDITAAKTNDHILVSDDKQAAVWLGSIDDLWSLGKVRGRGFAWKQTAVTAGATSDPYLLTGFDRKQIALSHDQAQPVKMHIQVDITGTGQWVTYQTVDVPAGQPFEHQFPIGFQAYWLRIKTDAACQATAELRYE
jgi:hypothetical protein